MTAASLGVPLPEDISLILGGFLAHKGAANLPIMMAVGFVGILAGTQNRALAERWFWLVVNPASPSTQHQHPAPSRPAPSSAGDLRATALVVPHYSAASVRLRVPSARA